MDKLTMFVRKLYSGLVNICREVSFHKDLQREQMKSHAEKALIENNKGYSLFLVPHADDDLFGGYALTSLLKDNICFGYYGLTGSNQDKNNKLMRDAEFSKYAKKLGISFYFITKPIDIMCLVNQLEITTIYLPSIIDWHPEHRKLNYDLLEALKVFESDREINIIWYSITVPICNEKVEIVPMTAMEQNEKYRLFKEHYKSQDFMPIKRFEIQERINSIGTSHYSAEVFLPVKVIDWKRIVERIMKEEPDGKLVKRLNEMKSRINNISKIRLISKEIYSNILG